VTLRLGFIGVGRWARKLAESFRACGAEVVAHDRSGPSPGPHDDIQHSDGWHSECRGCQWLASDRRRPAPGFGQRMPWRDQLADKSIDAIIAVAPPEVTTEVALAAAEAGRPVMATKPLFDHPATIRAPFYVDFWRLWSEAHQRAKGGHPRARKFDLYGCGPFRDFPGAYDYGPHVMAALLDAGLQFPSAPMVDWDDSPEYLAAKGDAGELREMALLHEGKEFMRCIYGNGGKAGARNIWGETETPTHIGDEPKEAIMQKFCSSFLSDVSEGYVMTDLLNYSREGMRLLRQIREMAK
jgi:hypothetical protein